MKIKACILTIILCSATLLSCTPSNNSLCSQTYFNRSFGVTVHHPESWTPFETTGPSVGIVYSGLNDCEGSCRAEIVITFFDPFLTPEDYFGIYYNIDTTHLIIKSFGGQLETKLGDKGTRKFAGKEWRVVEVREDGELGAEDYHSRETNYLSYANNGPITITTRIRGQVDNSDLNADIDCILNNLDFNQLTTHLITN